MGDEGILGEHKARIEQLERDRTALFDLHNSVVVPAMADLKIVSQNNHETTRLLSKLTIQVNEISQKQIICEAKRAQEKELAGRTNNAIQKYGVIAGICTFIGSALIGVYKLLTFMIANAK